MRKSMQESNENAKIRKNAQNANSDFKYKRILQLYTRLLKVQLINVNSKMRKNLFYFLTKKGRTFPLVKISFLKDIDSLGS